MNIKVDFTVTRYKAAQSKSYIDVTCTASQDSDSICIFVMQKLPKNALGQVTSMFSHVADPVDMQDYPDQETQDKAYFRSSTITLRVRSQFQVEHIIEVMRKEVKALAQALTGAVESEEVFSQIFTG